MKHAAKLSVHAIVFTFTIHVWHVFTSDHMVEALYDVGLDHVVIISEHVAGIVK